MPIKDFVVKHTDGGVLYHGTPSFDAAVSILRQGLWISDSSTSRNRTSAFGRGAYTSPRPEIAKGYANSSGVTLNLTLKQDERINILDWEAVKGSAWIKALEKKTGLQGTDLFPVLAKEHGVDIIINGHIMIQNSAIFETVRNADLLAMVRKALLKPNLPQPELIEHLRYFARLTEAAQSIEGPLRLGIPPEFAPTLEKVMKNPDLGMSDKLKFIGLYRSIEVENPGLKTLTKTESILLDTVLAIQPQRGAPSVYAHLQRNLHYFLKLPKDVELRTLFEQLGADPNQAVLKQQKLLKELEGLLLKYVEDGYAPDFRVVAAGMDLLGNDLQIVERLISSHSDPGAIVTSYFQRNQEYLQDPKYFALFEKFILDHRPSRSNPYGSGAFSNFIRHFDFKGLEAPARSDLLINFLESDRARGITKDSDEVKQFLDKLKRKRSALVLAPKTIVVPTVFSAQKFETRTRVTDGTKVEWLDTQGRWRDSGLRPPPNGIQYRNAHLDNAENLFVELSGTDQRFLMVKLDRTRVIVPDRMQWKNGRAPGPIRQMIASPNGPGVLALTEAGELMEIKPPAYPAREFEALQVDRAELDKIKKMPCAVKSFLEVLGK